MNRLYIAGPIFNKLHLAVVGQIKTIAELQGYTCFSPYEASRGIWKGRAPRDCTAEERRLVVRGNIDGLKWANVLVAWTGGQRSSRESSDTGTVWEMGYFKALQDEHPRDDDVIGAYAKIPRFTLAYIDKRDLRQHLNLMLAETIDAAVYGQAQLSEALNILSGDDDTQVVREKFHPSKLVMHEREPIG